MRTNSRTRHLALAAVAATACVAALVAWHPSSGTAQGQDPTVEPFPDLAAELADPSRSLVVALRFTDRYTATVESGKVVRSRTPGRVGDPPLLRVDMVGNDGAIADRFNAFHPLVGYEDDPTGSRTLVLDEATGHFVFPYSPHLATMKVLDIGRKEGPRERDVVTVDLHPFLRDYCLANPSDPDCRTDLAITKVGSPKPAAAGEDLAYTLTVRNNGPNPAHVVQVTDALPPELTHRSDTAGCAQDPPGTLTCGLGLILPGHSKEFTITALVGEDLVCQAGHPVEVTNTAPVRNLAGEDSDPSNNTGQDTTRVVDNTVGGAAFGEQGQVDLYGRPPQSSGPAPAVKSPTSGCGPFSQTRTLQRAGISPLYSARGMRVSVDGDRSGPDAFARSVADVTSAALGMGLVFVDGAHSECRATATGATATTTIGKLSVAGLGERDLRPAPNTRVPVPGVGTLILNEQVRSHTSPSGDQLGSDAVTVNALRLDLTGGNLGTGSVILGQSRCSIQGPHIT